MKEALQNLTNLTTLDLKTYKKLPQEKRLVLKYLAETQRKMARPDYMMLLTSLSPEDVNTKVFNAELLKRKNDIFRIERVFRRNLRNIFLDLFQKKQISIFHQYTARMGSNIRGQLFEGWMSKHFTQYQGGQKQTSIELSTRSGEGIVPDKIMDGSKGAIVIVEFKHLLPGRSLTPKDIEKIAAYFIAADKRIKVYNKKIIEDVEFIFSNKEAYDKNLYLFDDYLSYVQPRYIDNSGNLKP